MGRPALLGGKPVRPEPFPPRRCMGEEEKSAALAILDADDLSGFIGAPGSRSLGGPYVRAFERDWAQRYDFRHAISVNSWTSGLISAMGAIGIEPGDEVICSPYTMSASATCALFYGGVPVFADIDPESFCLDPVSVAQRLSDRTRAIVVVHLFGRPADMDTLLALARPRGIHVIEDAAQAPGARIHGVPVGALGDIGGFSLNCHKHIQTGEGGMIVTQDDRLAERCRLIRNHGENLVDSLPVAELPNLIGQNYRLTELQAAIGIAQLQRLEGLLAYRRRLAAYFAPRVAALPGLYVSPVPEALEHAYYVFAFRFDAEQAGLSRDLFLRAVRAELPAAVGVGNNALSAGYVRPLYLSPHYQQRLALGSKGFPFNCARAGAVDYSPGLCPVAERMHGRELLLCSLLREPLQPADLDDIIAAMERVLRYAPALRAAFAE
jgi:perosamine synthetase